VTEQFDTGVVTIMFTDVEGSTDLTRRLGDEAAQRTIEEHRRIVREQLAAHDGREIDSIGDGFMLTFLSTRRAIACAVAIQKALAEHGREHPHEEVRVRVGLNVGEVLERGGHPFGAAVNATQRVAAYAKGGQIFVSEPVRHLAGTIPDVQFRDRGRRALKGFSERWRLFEVVWEQPAKRAPTPKPAAKPGSRRRLLVAAAALAVVLVAVVAAFLALRGGDEPLDRVAPNSIGVIDPGTGEIAAEVAVGNSPVDITYDEENSRLWVANLDVGTISEVDPESRSVVGTFGVGAGPRGVAAGEGAVWIANTFANQVSLFDPQQDTVRDRADVPGPRDIAVGFGAVWVANITDRVVVRIDPTTLDVEEVGPGTAVALGRDAVWVANGTRVTRYDPGTGEPEGRGFTLRLPVNQITVDENGRVWATHTTADAVSRIDPSDGTSQTIENAGNDPTGIAVGEGAAWVASSLGRALLRIGLETRRVEETIRLGASPEAVVVADGHVWVTTQEP
jgi:class 3 adenylate cyclase/streptogramin lyase